MTSVSTLAFLRTSKAHKAQTEIVAAADEVAGEMGLSEREREIVLRLAAGALLWLPKL
jgi:DNA-binding CsgD family transcriptional regulator